MKRFKVNRLTAITLAAIITLSVTATGMTSVSAASTAESSVGSTAGDAAIAGANKAIDKLIEIGCDKVPGLSVLGAAGIGVIDSLFGTVYDTGMSLEDTDDHITRSTKDIIADIDNMSSQMTTYHNEEMTALKTISDKLDEISTELKKEDIKRSLDNFDQEHNWALSAHETFMNNISAYENSISNEFAVKKYTIIDESTYLAFRDIVSNCGVNTEFSRMKNYLNTKGGTFDLLYNLEKMEYDSDAEAQITSDGTGVKNINDLKQLVSYDTIKNDLKGYEAEMIVYYMDCLQLAQMQYDINNYEYYQNHGSDAQAMKKQLANNADALKNKAQNYYNALQEVVTAYNAVEQKYQNGKAAEVSIIIGADSYSFSVDDPMKGWLVMNTLAFYNTSNSDYPSEMVFTLNKDWATTGDFYPGDAYRNVNNKLPHDSDGYISFPQPNRDGLKLTVNLNGHSIKTPVAWKYTFTYMAVTKCNYEITINGDPDCKSTIDNAVFSLETARILKAYDCTGAYLNLNVNNVNLIQRNNPRCPFATFGTRGGGEIHVNNCKATYEDYNFWYDGQCSDGRHFTFDENGTIPEHVTP